MRFYTGQHQFYCGIDLHARSLYVCILDAAGAVVLHKNLLATPDTFLRAVAPYRADLVVAVECMFTWYWLADLCAREGIPFVLGHALYMKAIHGGKAKNDKIDAQKIALLLRGGMLPMAYVYPAEMRATRDLLRRRCHLMRKRSEAPDRLRPSALPKPSRGRRRTPGRPCSRAGRPRRSDCPSIRSAARGSRSSRATAVTRCAWNSPMAT